MDAVENERLRAGCRRPRRRGGATRGRSPRSPRSSCRSGARSARGRSRSTSTVGWKNGELKSAAQRTAPAPAGIACSGRRGPPSSSSRTAEPTNADTGAARMRASCRSSLRGIATSSASRRATYVPRASSRPRFSEPARPSRSSFRMTRRRASARPRGSPACFRRCVVDDEQLEIADGLAEDARERGPEVVPRRRGRRGAR